MKYEITYDDLEETLHISVQGIDTEDSTELTTYILDFLNKKETGK